MDSQLPNCTATAGSILTHRTLMESWRQAIVRVGRFLPDLHLRWEGARVLIIGHVATRWAFDHLLNGILLEDLITIAGERNEEQSIIRARTIHWRMGIHHV
jgi:hypothetical protein